MTGTALVLAFLLRAAILFALWLLLVDNTHEPELLTGGVVALVAAAAATLLRSISSVHAHFRPAMLRYAYRPVTLLVTDTARVTWALIKLVVLRRALGGQLVAVHFESRGNRPEDVARRVLAQWGASLAPNRYAIGIDQERDLLLVHELVEASGPLDPLELG